MTTAALAASPEPESLSRVSPAKVSDPLGDKIQVIPYHRYWTRSTEPSVQGLPQEISPFKI
jgi:hypothetical protein